MPPVPNMPPADLALSIALGVGLAAVVAIFCVVTILVLRRLFSRS